MKKILYLIIWFLFYLKGKFAFADAWIFEWTSVNREDWSETVWEWIMERKLREWDITTKDIPNMIKSVIDYGIYIAWTVAIIFIIVWAYKMLFWSIQQDKTKWKNTIIMAIWWLVIASLAWFIIEFIFDNFN